MDLIIAEKKLIHDTILAVFDNLMWSYYMLYLVEKILFAKVFYFKIDFKCGQSIASGEAGSGVFTISHLLSTT